MNNVPLDMPATQALTLSPSDSVEQPAQQNLSAAKWQRVDSITIFVENNHGAETTVIHGLKIFGVPIHGTNVSEIHKQYVSCSNLPLSSETTNRLCTCVDVLRIIKPATESDALSVVAFVVFVCTVS